MIRRITAATIALLLCAGAAEAQQQDFSNVVIRAERVADGVYVLFGQGGNIGVSVGDDGAFIIDDQFAPLTEKIRAAIGELTSEPVRFVLNTHWHGDHTGGNENFGKAGAMIVAHENVRRRLNPEEFTEVMGRTQQAPADALPVVTFTETMTFYWNGQKIRSFHVPNAHTDGDAIIVFDDSNVVHMGDTFFNGRFPFIDTNSGGDVDGIIAAADAVLRIAGPDTRIIPGHGDVTDVAALRAYRDMVAGTRTRVLALIERGMTEDQIVAANPTAEHSGFTGNPEGFVRAIVQTVR